MRSKVARLFVIPKIDFSLTFNEKKKERQVFHHNLILKYLYKGRFKLEKFSKEKTIFIPLLFMKISNQTGPITNRDKRILEAYTDRP